MALNFANKLHEGGADVAVLLNVDGVKVQAVAGTPGGPLARRGRGVRAAV
jgi:hypothetical protein